MKRALALVAALAAAARADNVVTRPEAIEVDRDVPPPGRVEFGFDGGAPVGAWGIGVQLGYMDAPIVLRDRTISIQPVHYRATLAIGGALALGDSVVVDARFPTAYQVGSRLQGLGDDTPLEHFVAGDVTIGARLRVAGDDHRGAFLRGQVVVPTGNDFQFAGDARWSGAWMLAGRIELVPGVVAAATGGIRIRAAEVQVGDRLVGDELAFGAGVAVALPPIAGLWCKPEQARVLGEVVGVIGDRVGGVRGPSPVEARFGFVGKPLPELAVGVRAGWGLDDQIGSPEMRAMVELAWQAPAAPRPAHPPVLEPAPTGDDDLTPE
jgi:hypothetical protein